MKHARAGLVFVLLSTAIWNQNVWGQQSSTLATADFTLTLQRPEGDKWVDLSVVDAQTYLNQARCLCDSPVRILVQMAFPSKSKLSQAAPGAYARLYAGVNCATLTNNQPTCPDGLLGTLNGLATLSSTGAWALNTTVSRLFGGGKEACAQTRSSTISLWVDSKGAGSPDPSISGSSAPSLGIGLDGTPPPAPKGIVAEGADQSLKLSWDPIDVERSIDLNGYLVFCMRGDGLPVFDPGSYNYQYMSGFSMCGTGAPPATDPMVSAAGDTTAVEIDAPQPFQDLDPRYLCSDRIGFSGLGYRLNGLQNDVPFTVGIAAVDISGNASPIRKAFVQKTVAGLDPLPDPDAGTTDAGATILGKAGCACAMARAGRDKDQMGWIGMLALALTLWLRRRSNPEA
jgi:MYXO-CTERM domain-containing protein